MPKFEFVHVERPGDEKKHSSKIRRHVMKDIGRSRRKPKNHGETTAARPIPVATPGPSSRNQTQQEQALVPSPLEECRLSDVVFPVEMDEERRSLARYCKSSRICQPSHPRRLTPAQYSRRLAARTSHFATPGCPSDWLMQPHGTSHWPIP